MGLSTYLKAWNYLSDVFDTDVYKSVHDALEDVIPLDIGLRHNTTANIEIAIPIAAWHRATSLDSFLWDTAGQPEDSEYELNLSREGIHDLIIQARRIAASPELVDNLQYGEEEDPQWIAQQFIRLERALTDFLLDDRLKNWTLKVWRSF
jgi:hypothetical protein